MTSFQSRDGCLTAKMPKMPELSETITFSSASEYACVYMLEKYHKHAWRAITGSTFDVKIEHYQFDLLVDTTIVEYHGSSLRSNLLTPLLTKIRSSLRKLPDHDRVKILTAISDESKAHYIRERTRIVASSDAHRDCNVLCVFSPEEYVDRVIIDLCGRRDLNREKLVQEFQRLRKSCVRKEKRDRKKKRR